MQSVSDGVVLLKGKAGERSVEFTITVDSTHNLSPFDAALPVHRLAAKAQIKQLEDEEKGSLLCLDLLWIVVICCFYIRQDRGYVIRSVFQSFCLSLCVQDYYKSNEPISLKVDVMIGPLWWL